LNTARDAELDIGAAGEFLVMAATLIHIKTDAAAARSRCPEEIEDPCNELVYQRNEHQKFWRRECVSSTRDDGGGCVHTVRWTDSNPEVAATYFSYSKFLRKYGSTPSDQGSDRTDEMTMSEKLAEITLMLNDSEEISARALFERARSRREMVLIFLSVLELVKGLVIRLTQSEVFGDIVIIKRECKL
jgi:segregation and condensation protein A